MVPDHAPENRPNHVSLFEFDLGGRGHLSHDELEPQVPIRD